MSETYSPKYSVKSPEVFNTLNKYILADGFDIVIDDEKSLGATLFDKRDGKKYVDFFTGFASMPIGWNHPKVDNPAFQEYIGKAALNKPANSDVYTEYMATFVETFFKVAVPDYFKYAFFVSGGALAVENAIKTAIDWKVRQNFRKGFQEEKGHQILHFKEAFHGRSGYTMSLTNTDPIKVAYFPKFDWPRIINPKCTFPVQNQNLRSAISLEEKAIYDIKNAFEQNKDDIAAIIIEPIQGEGGDNHFRQEFHEDLRNICDSYDVLLIHDEVQTGVAMTGKMWCHQNYDVQPDIMCFGKKMQVCGILCGEKIDTEPDNVFKTSSRINSTWGGNLVDMVRATRYLEIIEEDNLLDNVNAMAEILMAKMAELQEKYPDMISNSRGQGLYAAFDLASGEKRNELIKKCWENGLIILGCGNKTLRFRTPLNVTEEELLAGWVIIEKVMAEISLSRD